MTSPTALRARAVAASLIDRVPEGAARPLAAPPPGSGLAPVMGDPGLPVIGNTLNMLHDALGAARRFRERFGPIGWSGALGTRVVIVFGPDGLETVLANRDQAFSNAEGWGYFIGPFFHRGVMLMDFAEHRHHRLIMQQAFKRERLVAYLQAMNPAIARGIAGWRPGAGFEMYRRTKALTLDIASEVFVGQAPGAEADRLNRAFVDTVTGGFAIVRADVPGGKWHRGLQSRRLLEAYFRRRVPGKRASDGDDLFSVLCRAEGENGERFTDEDVVNHMIFVMMAAHDTSTITLAMMAYYLARHPEWQERLRDESRALGRAWLQYDDLDALTSMDLVFRETLRMNAPVGSIARRAISDTEIYGRYVPAGSLITLGVYATQRMEPWWQDPDRFDPERFAPERREDAAHKYAWVPFGGGVHKCIGLHFGGMEVKAILHQLLLRRRWTIPPGYEPVIDHGTGPFPGDGLPIELHDL